MSTSRPMRSATRNLRACRPLRLGEISSPVTGTSPRFSGRNDIECSCDLKFCNFRTTAHNFKYTLDHVHQMFLLVWLKSFEKLGEYFSTMREPDLKNFIGFRCKSNTDYPFVMRLAITCHMPIFFQALTSN